MFAGLSERLSVRVALAIGFCATLGLWLYTGYAFNQRLQTVQDQSNNVAARYTRAQDLLSLVRAQVLLSSVRVRDAMLEPTPSMWLGFRQQVESAYATAGAALDEYQQVIGSLPGGGDTAQLRAEVEEFHRASLDVLADTASKSPREVREILNQDLMPRRDAALTISEEIQAANRRAFIEQQATLADINHAAELESRRALGIALVIGLGVVLLTSLYAGRLEGRLRAQLERDVRITRELHDTATKLIGAQEEERRRIARELHDEVGQVLTALKLELVVAQRKIAAAGGPVEPIVDAQQMADSALQTVRSLTQMLHPSLLDDLGLVAAIDATLRALMRRHDIKAELRQAGMAPGAPARLPREVEFTAYRIIQEALTNIVKHACAQQCTVQLTQLPGRLLVEVEDDGVGFSGDAESISPARGLGLVSVRERVSRLGGTFNIVSHPGQGTRLIVSLPDGGVVA